MDERIEEGRVEERIEEGRVEERVGDTKGCWKKREGKVGMETG